MKICQRCKSLALALIISAPKKFCVKLNSVMQFCRVSDVYVCFQVQGKRNRNIFENYIRGCNLNPGFEPAWIPRSYSRSPRKKNWLRLKLLGKPRTGSSWGTVLKDQTPTLSMVTSINCPWPYLRYYLDIESLRLGLRPSLEPSPSASLSLLDFVSSQRVAWTLFAVPASKGI